MYTTEPVLRWRSESESSRREPQSQEAESEEEEERGLGTGAMHSSSRRVGAALNAAVGAVATVTVGGGASDTPRSTGTVGTIGNILKEVHS